MRTRVGVRFFAGGTAVSGLSAVELLVVLALLGVLSGLAPPAFMAIVERWRVSQSAELLRSTLYVARSEAIKRGGGVVIQKLANGTGGCTSASSTQDWDCGWFVCADTNANGVCNTAEPVIARYETPMRVQVTRTGGGSTIRFDRWGTVAGTFVGFSLVPLDKSISHPAARGVCMSSGGRVRLIPPEAIPCSG